MRFFGRCAIAAGLLAAGALLIAAGSPAQEAATAKPKTPTAQETEFFETNVRPLLFEKCFSCHGQDSSGQWFCKGQLIPYPPPAPSLALPFKG